jgi:hypothetical protein
MHRDVLVHFFVYVAIVGFFKGRDAAKRLPALVTAARAPTSGLSLGPVWLRAARLLVGYDSWSRTERVGIIGISALVCTVFGWDDGGPFAASLFVTVGTVNALLALTAWGARITRPRA